jgi:hypothetical protein
LLGGGIETISAAVPDLEASCEEVAFTVSGPVALEGAVYVAASLVVGTMVPRPAAQVTVGSKLPVPWTVAEHRLVWFSSTVIGVHETLTDVIVGGGVTVTVAVPDFVESCMEVALIVSDPEAGTVGGAVYSPEPEIVPETADQVTVEE